MVCKSCKYSMVQTYRNGEQTFETVWCKVIATIVGKGLEECEGFRRRIMIEDIISTPVFGQEEDSRTEPVEKPALTKAEAQSVRMKEYWAKRKTRT